MVNASHGALRSRRRSRLTPHTITPHGPIHTFHNRTHQYNILIEPLASYAGVCAGVGVCVYVCTKVREKSLFAPSWATLHIGVSPEETVRRGGCSPSHISLPLWSLANRVARQKVCHSVLLARPVLHRKAVRLQRQEPAGNPSIGVLHAAQPLQGAVVSLQGKVSTKQVIF